ncbi:hypothetical protein QRD43_19835 [Pelomonas sp. APW6]|uniref:SWIM-type domain-containing protein n=1 Tax=Roseateles subflavus TaxID=3053353 RepID=A0ABT7LMR4_9BURK|nr:helicase-related protein [Pelomonas sp. APW6]MDL5034161.1 hypothetical protein [Pelomonas sp. APW6]
MATSKTPRRKAAPDAAPETAAPAPVKKPAAKTAPKTAPKTAAPTAAKVAAKTATKTAPKTATKAATKAPAKAATKAPAQAPVKAAAKAAAVAPAKTAAKKTATSAKTAPAAKKAAVAVDAPEASTPAKVAKASARTSAKTSAKKAPVKTAAARKVTAKPVKPELPVVEPEASAARKPAKKGAAQNAGDAVTPVATPAPRSRAAAPKAKAADPVAAAAKPARKRKAADVTVEPVAAKPARKATAQPVDTPAAPAGKTRKTATPAVAAPVAALVAEVAAAFEQPAPEAGSRRGRKAAAPVAVPDAPPARKSRAAKPVAVAEAPQAPDAERLADVPAPVTRPQGPDWRWHKTQPGLFGSYAIQSAGGETLATLDLQGSALGRYRCSCAEFQDSEAGDCAHSHWLIAQLAGARAGQAERLAAGPDTPYSELTLSAGWERRLVWRLGQGASPALRALAEDWADEEGRFIAPLEGQVLPALLQAAAEEGHELRVAPDVWQQLALSADAGDRVERLAQRFEEGLASPALHALVKTALPELQWEAALFAVCAGRALLADESPLPQRASAVVAARLWQTGFDVGTVAIVAPAELQAAWRDEAQRLLGAWPADWTLTTPGALDVARGCELLIVDAIETLGEALPSLQAIGAPQLILLAQQELLGTALLAPLVAWLDEARRGPYAALRRLGAEAGKRQQREVLEAVMLARRRRDLAQGLPASLAAQLSTTLLHIAAQDAPGVQLDAADVQAVTRLHQRWSRLGSLSAGEQLQLQQALLRLRHGEGAQAERRGEARAAALVRLLPELVPARAERVVVFAQQDAALRPLALALQDLGLPLANLRQHQSAEVRALELQAWAEGEASVLLATDAACAGLELRQEGSVLVHADVSWNPALMRERQARVAIDGGEVPAWVLVLESALDAAVLAAHGEADALPSAVQDGEAGAIPFLAGTDLQAFMEALGRALAALPGA